MSKSSIRSPAYCRHKAKGLAYDRLSGHVFYLGSWQSPASKAEYRRLLAIFHANGGRTPASVDCTVSELLDRYRVHCEAYYRHLDGTVTGEAQNIGYCCKPLRELYGSQNAASFGPLDLQAVRQEMTAGRKWSRTLVNAAIRRIVHAFKWAASQEIVPSSTHQALTTVEGWKAGRCDARESPPVNAVDDATIAATISRFVETILTVIETCQRQSRSSFEYLTAALTAHFNRQHIPSLLVRV